MKVAVVGGGWTGCHLALRLKGQGVNVTLYESEKTLFAGASGNNQCRLHLGFHYPRTYGTIREMADSYEKFKKLYPQFVVSIAENIYAVASSESLLDFETFCSIMRSHGISFQEESAPALGLEHVEGAVSCGEMAIDNYAAARYFQNELGSIIRLGTKFDFKKKSEFDWVINSTYNLSAPFQKDQFKFEVCTLFSYQCEKFKDSALTVMDGPFASVYPLPGMKNGFTLSGVKETAISVHSSPEEATLALKNVSAAELKRVRQSMEEKMSYFYPAFEKHFKYVAPILTLKTKPRNEADSRRWHKVVAEGNLIHAFSSKITNIFPVETEVLAAMGLGSGRAAA